MSTGTVYVLTDPRDRMIRYVGATTSTLAQRLSGHCSAARPDRFGSIKHTPVLS